MPLHTPSFALAPACVLALLPSRLSCLPVLLTAACRFAPTSLPELPAFNLLCRSSPPCCPDPAGHHDPRHDPCPGSWTSSRSSYSQRVPCRRRGSRACEAVPLREPYRQEPAHAHTGSTHTAHHLDTHCTSPGLAGGNALFSSVSSPPLSLFPLSPTHFPFSFLLFCLF